MKTGKSSLSCLLEVPASEYLSWTYDMVIDVHVMIRGISETHLSSNQYVGSIVPAHLHLLTLKRAFGDVSRFPRIEMALGWVLGNNSQVPSSELSSQLNYDYELDAPGPN